VNLNEYATAISKPCSWKSYAGIRGNFWSTESPRHQLPRQPITSNFACHSPPSSTSISTGEMWKRISNNYYIVPDLTNSTVEDDLWRQNGYTYDAPLQSSTVELVDFGWSEMTAKSSIPCVPWRLFNLVSVGSVPLHCTCACCMHWHWTTPSRIMLLMTQSAAPKRI